MDGRIVSGKLQLTPEPLLGAASPAIEKATGSKPVTFAKIPAFDQLTEYITQAAPVDGKSAISVGVVVNKCAMEAMPVIDVATKML